MKFRWLAIWGLVVWTAGLASAEEKTVLQSKKDKTSYLIGIEIGRNFKSQQMDIDPDLMIRGIRDGISGNKALLSEQEMNELRSAVQKEMMARREEQFKQMAEKNKKEESAFLAQNGKKEGVVVLPSGLQYKIIKPGGGKKPKATDSVTVHYRGTLIDGTEFDSSYRRGNPATFQVNRVIPGWTEALQLMPGGAKWQLFIPSKLAYGERGAGGQIGPNAALIFEVELLSVQESK